MAPVDSLAGPAGYGAFGKMPALGDFFRIGLPPSFVDPWDRWLQTGLAGARDLLGARWEECYMTAPIWRFTLDAGLAGPLAAQGVLMPSVDRVGRQFPLTLARLLPGRPGVAAADAAAHDAFAALEEVALDALDDRMTRDRLSRLLAAIPVPVPTGPATGAAVGPVRSLWSALIDGRLCRIEHAGLPDPAQMRALFDPAPADLPAVTLALPLAASAAGPPGDPLADLLADALDDPPADEARP